MKILLVGGGGREHALAWALAQSNLCTALYCAPGNAGIETCAECVDIAAEDVDALTAFAKDKSIDFVVVGPEGPLVKGLADNLRKVGIKVFGPSAAAARLEGSKGFMKDLCKKYKIPTAAYERFTDFAAAKPYIEAQKIPVVIKADGLAAGKGVIIAQTHKEALDAAEDMLSGNSFGAAGAEIVVEEFLDGEELSYFALADGRTILPLNSAQDHKRVGDGDTGPNTGGMGAYSPAHLMTPALEEEILKTIVEPTVKAMQDEGCPFTGVLYAGLMIVDGQPKLIEYNARFGDPECQALMLRLEGDIGEILLAAAEGRLSEATDKVRWKDQAALCVVMAASGYPGSYEKNTIINNLLQAEMTEGAVIFHAGTAKNEAGELISVSGRVLGITALGDTIAEAQSRAYESVAKIDWPEGFCRKDIGWRAVKAEKEQAA